LIISRVLGLISHSPSVGSFFTFTIAKATRQDVSYPKLSSDTDPDIDRVATPRLVCKDMCLLCTCVGWSEASLRNWRLHRTITRQFGKKDAL